jgi:hypothetical protein
VIAFKFADVSCSRLLSTLPDIGRTWSTKQFSQVSGGLSVQTATPNRSLAAGASPAPSSGMLARAPSSAGVPLTVQPSDSTMEAGDALGSPGALRAAHALTAPPSLPPYAVVGPAPAHDDAGVAPQTLPDRTGESGSAEMAGGDEVTKFTGVRKNKGGRFSARIKLGGTNRCALVVALSCSAAALSCTELPRAFAPVPLHQPFDMGT